jgi:hypothetical protein
VREQIRACAAGHAAARASFYQAGQRIEHCARSFLLNANRYQLIANAS